MYGMVRAAPSNRFTQALYELARSGYGRQADFRGGESSLSISYPTRLGIRPMQRPICSDDRDAPSLPGTQQDEGDPCHLT